MGTPRVSQPRYLVPANVKWDVYCPCRIINSAWTCIIVFIDGIPLGYEQ